MSREKEEEMRGITLINVWDTVGPLKNCWDKHFVVSLEVEMYGQYIGIYI